MVKDKDIKQFMLRHQPEVKNSGPFMKDVVRQINAMPIPAAMNPERQKEDCIRLDENNYLAVVDTAITGCGVLDARVSAFIPDADCEDGIRTEMVIVKGIETIY